MRLLEFNTDGELSLTTFFADKIPPKYAILSHTWEAEEVTFEDLQNGTGIKKAGYQKIRFCGEQARSDGLQYFWVDTCCIDKSSSAELTEAINSMFRWYCESTKCYVYLSDVQRNAVNTNDLAWEAAFRESRWFTRGWTLQELIAPTLVEFFSKGGGLLGDKSTLERYVREITGIPAKALRGGPLSDFSIAERMSWVGRRKTTCEEDQAYSLLGIFDISIPVIYGEGREKALRRLQEEIDKASKGMKREDFSVTFNLSDVPKIENFVAREFRGDMAEQNIGDASANGAEAVLHQAERCKLCSNLIIDEDEPPGIGLHGGHYVSYLEESHKNGCRFCGYLLQIQHLFGIFVRWNFIGDRYSGYCERPTFGSLKISNPTCPTSRGERIVVRPWQVWHKSLEIYREHSGLPSPFSKPIAVGERADSASTWTFLQGCLTWCATHASCAQEGPLCLPTRLLHLECSAGIVSLVETKQGDAMPYVALSHCWGGDLPVKLTTANYESFQRGLPWGSLPNTFQDAATVAVRFDIAYIWIDALCIIQDDASDWAKEAAQMADVYSNAHFTISAASSKDGSISFLKQQRTMPLVLGLEDDTGLDSPPEQLLARKRFETGIHSYGKVFDATLDPTDLRGWILQEKVLSRRTMVFSSEEVQWECRKARVCECSGITPWDSDNDQQMHGRAREEPRKASHGPASLETWRSSPEQRHESWNTLISDYTFRSLTKETDKLVAFSGMARKFSSYDNSAYYAGIWQSSLPAGLCWYVYQHYRVQSLLPQSYIAPSFSWASVKGNVDIMPAASGGFACAVNNVDVSLATADLFGAVHSGSITLIGVLMTGEMSYNSSWAGIRVNRKSGNPGAYTVSFKGTVEFMSNQDTPAFYHDCELVPRGSADANGEVTVARSIEASPTSWGPSTVYLLPLCMATSTTSRGVGMYGLVLGRRSGGSSFERLGLFPFRFDFEGLHFEDMSTFQERIRGFFAAATLQVVVIA